MLKTSLSFNQLRRTFISISIIGLCLFLALRIAVFLISTPLSVGFDARSYVMAAQAVRQGYSPYEAITWRYVIIPNPTAKYLYPPLLALLLTPLSLLPFIPATYVCVVLAALAAALLVVMIRRFIGWKLAILAVLAFPPTWQTIYLGQVNLLIALLVTFALYSTQRNKTIYAGVALAFGTLLKITPVFMAYGVSRRWRYQSGFAFTGTIAVSILLTLPFVSFQTWVQGGLAAVQQHWVSADFVSWVGLCAYWMGARGELLGIALGMALMSLTLLRIDKVPRSLALAAGILVPLLIARVTWEHHAVMALPALLVLWQSTQAKKSIAATTWILIGLFGGIIIPMTLTICWIACCWPDLDILSRSKMWLGKPFNAYCVELAASAIRLTDKVCRSSAHGTDQQI